jgi:hypothetical protein
MATASAPFGSRRTISVRLIGRDPKTKAVEFEATLNTAPGQNTFSPPFVVSSDRKLRIEFGVIWPDGPETRAGAEVRGFEEARISQTSTAQVLAEIKHAKGEGEDCELICLDTGKSSSGPCLDCSDGTHTIRICC